MILIDSCLYRSDCMINKKKICYLVLFTLGLIDYVPDNLEPVTLIFSASYILLLGNYFVSKWYKGAVKIWDVLIFFWLLVLLVGCFSGIVKGNPVNGIVRSVIPFIFLITFAIFIDVKDFNSSSLALCGIVVSLIWCMFVMLANHESVLSILTTGGRLSFYDMDSILPYPLFGFLLVLFSKISVGKKIPALLFFSIMILLVGYRAFIILSLFALFIFLVEEGKIYLLVLTLCCIGVLFAFIENDFINTLLSRFKFGSGDQVRLAEINVAYNVFSNSPIFGGGVGVVIDSDTGKTFIHNSVMYMLMSQGVLGLISYLFFLLSPLVYILRNTRLIVLLFSPAKKYIRYSLYPLLIFLLSTLTSASYKLIHTNVLVSVLMAIIVMSAIECNRNVLWKK